MVDTRHKQDSWSAPRPYTDASYRRMKYGPIQPMEYDRPGIFGRIFGIFRR